jgi:hypothetical protein
LTQILDKNRPAATHISKPALSLVGAFAVLCVVTLPQTPQFVAFDRTPAPDQESAALVQPTVIQPVMVQTAMLRTANAQTSFRPAAVTPAALRLKTNQPLSPRKNSKYVAARAAVVSQPARREAAGSNPLSPESLIEASAAADQSFQNFPAGIRAVVFVETAQFVPVTNENSASIEDASSVPAATVWRVQVWRVTIINAVWEHAARVPVASKT